MEQTAPEIVTWLEEEVAVDLALVASGVDQALPAKTAKTAKTAALGSQLTPYGLVAVMHVMHC
ncbi:hypothetical protein DPV78_008026 [Talaromyces pinophilus]|nr:hypothetical protein DPV78_008026 [Talaromyces pinophilus]